MNKSFRRILDLVRRTGDRMVVTDPEGEEAFVVMDLEQYEALVELEEQYFTQMHQDDADEDEGEGYEPPTEPGPEDSGPSEPPPDIWDVMTPGGEGSETWDLNKLSPAERAELERQFAETEKKMASVGEPEAKSEAETTQKPPTDDEFGEEQFYLEPIE